MRVLVTGGAGFIGANLVRHLKAEGADVVVLDDLSSGSSANIDETDIDVVIGSVFDADLVSRVLHGVDAVVHLGAVPSVQRSITDPMTTHTSNVTGTLTLLEGVRRAGNPHFVVASSSSVYGDSPTLPKHEDLRPRPKSPYAVSKLATEAYALAYQDCFETPVLAFRFFNVYGPLQGADHAYAAVIPLLVAAGLEGRTFTIDGDGQQTRDFTHVASVCQAITTALTKRVTCTDPVNLAFGTRTSINELVALVEDALGRPVRVEHGAPRDGDVRDSQADTTRLRELGLDVVPTPLPHGLKTVVDWMGRSVTAPSEP